VKLVAACLALAVMISATGVTGSAHGWAAEKRAHPQRRVKGQDGRVRGYRSPKPNGGDGYQEQLLDKAPFGSKTWWHIYEAQPRGG